ncbi:MAG TPA: Uma2 family endonuclease [Planctomycetota bacterium]|nr:Uma2 family endonuclease [Planctomycetota bacterium]
MKYRDTIFSEPRTHRFTREEYYAMGDIGLFADQRVELIEGEIVEMSPHNKFHAGSVGATAEMFTKAAPPGLVVRCQLPLDLGLSSEPEPDISSELNQLPSYAAAWKCATE